MVTTGELRAIIEELQLVDIGDAASYLGEEAMVGEADAGSVFRLPRLPDNQTDCVLPAVRHSETHDDRVPTKVSAATVEEVNSIGAFSMSAQ